MQRGQSLLCELKIGHSGRIKSASRHEPFARVAVKHIVLCLNMGGFEHVCMCLAKPP